MAVSRCLELILFRADGRPFGEMTPIKNRQYLRQIFRNETGPRFPTRLAMKPNTRSGRLKGWHSLRTQPKNKPRQHVTRTRGGEPGRRIIRNCRASVRRGDDGIRTFQNNDGAGVLRRELGAGKLVLHVMMTGYI